MNKNYEGCSMELLEDNFDDGECSSFVDWLNEHYPEIEVTVIERTSGIGGGFWDANGNHIEDDLWEMYCSS